METPKTNEKPHIQTAPFDVETMLEMSNPATEVVKTFNSKLVENVGAYQKEWFGFFSQRLQENMNLPLRLATCKSMPEVQEVYASYWKRAAVQYGTEFSHVLDAAQHKPIAAESTVEKAKSRPVPAGALPTVASKIAHH